MRFLLFLFLAVILFPLKADTNPVHFIFTSGTGNYATIGIPLVVNPSIGDTLLSPGDEIGVFTPEGLCVGAVVYTDTANIALTAWGNDFLTPAIDGLRAGEIIHYRIWRRDTNTEYEVVEATYTMGDGIYQAGGIYVLATLQAIIPDTSALEPPALIDPPAGATGTPTEVLLRWAQAENAESYALQVSLTPVFSSIVETAVDVRDTVYQLTGLGYFLNYYWRVRSESSEGLSGWSQVRRFTTLAGVPAISDISADTVGWGDTLNVTMSGSEFYAGYTQIVADTGLDIANIVFQSRSQLRATLMVSEIAAPGDNTLYLVNPPPGGGESNRVTLHVLPYFWSITGTVLDGGAGLPGATVVLDGAYRDTTVTDDSGMYLFDGIRHGTTDLTITPSFSGFLFQPESIMIDGPVESDITGIDFIVEEKFYTIYASSDENSFIQPEGEISVESGEDRGFLMGANPGYNIARVVVDGIDRGYVSSYLFSNVQSDHTISVSSVRSGDVLGDDLIGIGDLTAVIDHLLGRIELPDLQLRSADVNGDGEVDLLDVIVLRDSLLSADLLHTIHPGNGEAGETPGIHIEFMFSDTFLTVAIRNEIPVKGLYIALGTPGIPQADSVFYPTFVQHAAQPMSVVGQVINGEMRIVSYNPENRPIQPGYGTLFGFPVPSQEIEVLAVYASVDDGSELRNLNAKIGYEMSSETIPVSFSLKQNYPNPFNSTTVIEYEVPSLSVEDSNVLIQVFSLTGQKIKTLAKGPHNPGTYAVTWDGSDSRGFRVTSGMYICRIWNKHISDAVKMIYVK